MKSLNKNGLEIVPSTFILLLVVIAAGAAVMLILMGKWLDIVGFRYKMETQRNAMNLIQLIVTNSPIVEKEIEPNKIIIDSESLDSYETNFEVKNPSNPSQEHIDWEGCCDFLDFDHNLTVIDIGDPDIPDDDITSKFGNLIFKEESECYPNRIRGFADLPVVVQSNGEYNPGLAYVEVMKTPLSELSFWLSQAFMRTSWDKYWDVFSEEESYSVSIVLDPEIKQVFIDEVKKRICVCVDYECSDPRSKIACKEFFYDENVEFKKYESSPATDCYYAKILMKKEPGCIGIYYPGPGTVAEEC